MTDSVAEVALPLRPRPSSWARAGRLARRKPLGTFGLVMTVGVVLLALFGRYITSDPNALSADVLQSPSADHWFGTDPLGRDYLARIIAGAELSVRVAFSAMAIGTAIGLVVGMMSAYLGGLFDLLLQRVVDTLLAFPGLILVMFLASIFGASATSLSFALGLLFAPGLARLVRASMLSVLAEPYIESARVVGASPARIMIRHALPNIQAPLLVYATAFLGAAILAEAGLSFLGLGVAPPTPSWGRMLSESRTFLREPWLSIFPGVAITIAVLAINLLGDGLRDVWDPRLRVA